MKNTNTNTDTNTDTDTNSNSNSNSNTKLINNIELSDIYNNNSNTSNRIGIDTCLSDILNSDTNIRIFLLVCGIYTDDSKQSNSIIKNLWKTWSLLLFILTIIGLGGYMYDTIVSIDPSHGICHDAFHKDIKRSFISYMDVFVVLMISPLLQLFSIGYSLYSINIILNKAASIDNIKMYKNSYKGSLIFMITMVTNVMILWIALGFTLPSCEFGEANIMLFFDFSTIFYTSYVTFFIVSYINQINMIQEEILSIAKKQLLTMNIYSEKTNEIKKLSFDLNFSMQILITTALLNALCWTISIVDFSHYYSNVSFQQTVIYMYSDSALFLKELVMCIYLCIISVKINTLSDDLSDELANSNWLNNNDNSSIEKDHMRLSLYIKATSDPISFKILTKRISLTDIYASIIAIISSIIISLGQKLIND